MADTPANDGALPPPPDQPPGTSAPTGAGARGFDRVPPHSLEAEVSVLGACLLARSAAIEVSEFLHGEDFYRSAHRVVYEAVLDLMQRGEPVDPVTLLDHLAATDRLAEVGGAQAIHDLVSATPTAANAVHYGRIVRDRALLRRLIEAGTDIVQLGYDPTDDPVGTVSHAESIMFAVADSGATGEATALKDLLSDSFRAIEELAERGDDVTGLPTGFRDLDRITAGLQPQNLVILAARPAMGKCISASGRVCDVLSGSLMPVGDVVKRGTAGKPFTVLATNHDLRQTPTDVAEFHDNGVAITHDLRTRLGRSIRATANHPFLTPTGWRELHAMRPGDLIAVPRAISVEGKDPLAPCETVLLAYLIGDGSITQFRGNVTTGLQQVADEVRDLAPRFGMRVAEYSPPRTSVMGLTLQPAHEIDHLREWLQELGLWGCDSHARFVPDPIFRAPNDQVAMFLSRLYATDGSAWVAKDHGYFGISYASISERLIRDVQHLLLRFGIIARIRERSVACTTPDGERTRRPAFELEIRDAENVLRFLDRIGIFARDGACAQVRAAAEARNTSHTDSDLLPVEVWDDILAAKGDRSWADVSEATGRPRNHNWHVGRRRPGRRLVGELAEALDSDDLRAWAYSDVHWDEVVSITEYGPEPVYDLTVPGLHNFVADDIVVHNSSLSLSMAHYVTAELQEPVAIFSLEMSKQEIVQRLLASEAMIDSSRIRTGRLEDHDWRKLGEALGKLAEAPLYIDDTPSINLMEITSKCRRLKQQHGLSLVIVDYLQLMTSHRRVDNRQEEVAGISRGLKMMAKELDIPVVALSQLNRSPEARTDKRPLLADLRESGCLTRDTRLFRADTGTPVTFGELLDQDAQNVPIWAADSAGRLVPGRLTHAFPSGRKEVFRVRLRSGRVVDATANHPFRTLTGWTPLGELEVGSRVAAARRLPEPTEPVPMDRDEVVLLAHLIGEGTIVARQPVHYTSADRANLEAVEKAALRRFGITARHDRDGRSARTTQLHLPSPYHLTHGRRNPIAAWLDELGLWDHRSWEKFLPAGVFALPDDQVALFLHHLWSTDGTLVLRRPDGGGPHLELSYSTSSERLARDLQLLLLRLDIRATVRRVPSRSKRSGYRVVIAGVEQQRRFLASVGIHGEQGERVPAALARLDGIAGNPNVDVLPVEVWNAVRECLPRAGMTTRAFQAALGMQFCGSGLYASAPSRTRLSAIAEVLDDEALRALASDDLLWDEIVEIESLSVQEVFDATVDGLHNFVAEGLVLHNSVEQDADIVGFIYRDEVYHEDTPDRGIAELIISKHRNGGTGVVKLAFLGHVTKFANLARGGMGGTPDGPPAAPPPGVPADGPPL